MTHQRTLTAAHWGVYEVEYDDNGKATRLHPFSKDPDPSPIGLHMLSDEVTRLRVRRPAVRKSWLEKGPGAAPEKRGQEPFVELEWDEALDLVAKELKRVKDTHSNRAIFGGSYGWSSAGRFHHAQSQVHRFLNSVGGYVRHQDSYSLGAARVLMPHIVAPMDELMSMHTPWDVHGRALQALRHLRRRAAQERADQCRRRHRASREGRALRHARQGRALRQRDADAPTISTPAAPSSGWRSGPTPTPR